MVRQIHLAKNIQSIKEAPLLTKVSNLASIGQLVCRLTRSTRWIMLKVGGF